MIVARSFERFFRPGPVFKARGVGATARLYEETTKERSRGCGCGCEARPCSPEEGGAQLSAVGLEAPRLTFAFRTSLCRC